MASKVIYSVIAVVGIAAASAGAWWYQSRPTGPKEITAAAPGGSAGSASAAVAPLSAGSAPRAAGVEVARVERARLQDDAQSVGTLRSRQSVMMRPEVAGRVRELGFQDGATVRRGQLLVQLDDTLQRAEIKQAQAQVSIAQANFKRNQELVAQSFVAQRVLEESGANLQVAEAQLALACARLSRMAIVAPFDGTVGMRNVNLGDYVKDGADLVNLEDTRSMLVDFRLPERYQNKLRVRQTVELQLDSMPGRLFKATVEAIDPLLDVNGRSVGVRAVLPNTMGEAAVSAGRPGAAAGQPGSPPGVSGRPSAAAHAGGPARAGDARNAGSRPAAAPNRPAGNAAGGPARGPAETSGCAPAVQMASSSGGAGRPGAFAGPSAGNTRGGASAPLRPGMFARVITVFAVKEAALLVPEEAIVPQGGRQFVIKVVEPTPGAQALPPDAKLVSLRQEVKLGTRQLGKVEVTDGLVEGDSVVVAGQQRLQRDGTPVRVVDLGPPQGAGGAPAPRASASMAAASP